MNENIFDKRRLKTFSNCKELVRSMVGTRDGVIVYNEKFRVDLENTCYKASICEDLQQENQELKKQYCERTDCSGRLGNSKKVDQLEKENQRLKEIEKEHQKMNGDLRIEIKELKDRIDKIVEIIEKEIESLKDKKRMIMQILTPENGYLKTDVEYEIKRLERYLEILKGDKE